MAKRGKKTFRLATRARPPKLAVSHMRAAAAKPARSASARLRLYCQGIGDCHLLRFTQDNGSFFWMLIDCGVHGAVAGGSAKIGEIVDDILSITRRLDVIVLTHEHTDHNSGFLSAQEKFKKFDYVGEVWMAWTENGRDPQARELDKFKDEALTALQRVSRKFAETSEVGPHLAGIAAGIDAVLGFNFSAQGERVRAARNAAAALAKNRVKYLEPKTPALSLPGLSNLRIYVLGPPRDAAMLRVTERPAEMYGLAAIDPVASALHNALNEPDGGSVARLDSTAPFDGVEGFDLTAVLADAKRSPDDPDESKEEDTQGQLMRLLRRTYTAPQEAWRRIDNEWLAVAADLAIQMDKRTNNSSLVLAFEFIPSGRVMLFVGDAQIGNWLSWDQLKWNIEGVEVQARDLLARTVFYKVGHHGSHNATLRQRGLELMTSSDLVAFIPTNQKDAKNVGWGGMPFGPLLTALKDKAQSRVIRADAAWLQSPAGRPEFAVNSGSIKEFERDPGGLWVQLDIA